MVCLLTAEVMTALVVHGVVPWTLYWIWYFDCGEPSIGLCRQVKSNPSAASTGVETGVSGVGALGGTMTCTTGLMTKVDWSACVRPVSLAESRYWVEPARGA